ncbi:MAG: efflux RND transporter periplasmic adaptor subunit [Citrobacter freundii]|nr:MAG: efflux RND transporter periplasmic adaptor subunit [Citrobacter freundii]
MKQVLSLSVIAAFAVLALSACSDSDANQTPEQEPLISDSTMSLISIDTASIRNVDDELKLSGEVSFDDNKVVKVFPFSSGQVLSVNVSIGDYVKAGQTLATIKSADVAGNYADLSSAGNDISIAKRNMDNMENLYKNGIASEKEFAEAKENYNKSVTAATKIRTQIQINGGGKTNANGTYTVTAPRAGYVVEKLINPGNFIRNDNSTNMFTIGDVSDVWIWANVYETDLAKVKPGYEARVTTLAYPDSVFTGKVDEVNKMLDPETKVMKVKIVLPNDKGLLSPQMFANVFISNIESRKMVAIPAAAIINDNQKNYVVVYKNNNDVTIREINILKTVNNIAYISTGLNAGEKVITRNQLLIYKKLLDLNNQKVAKK